MKQHSAVEGLLVFLVGQKPQLFISLLLAFAGVVCGLMPYFIAGDLIRKLLAERVVFADVKQFLILAAVCFAGRGACHSISTIVSHRCAFLMLERIRIAVTEKMERLSMGQVQQYSSGAYKNLILDETEKLEYPVAHAIPEVGGNLLAFLSLLLVMFLVDWRLALASLITLPIGLLVTKLMYQGFGERYQKFMDSSEFLNQTMVEYVSGIEVIKVFGHKEESYRKLKQAVLDFRDYTLAWYRHNWPYTSINYAVFPAAVTGVLPVGALLYLNGILELPTLLLFVLFTQGLIAPLIKIMEFEDNFATIVQTEAKIHEFLSLQEMEKGGSGIKPADNNIVLENIHFSYEKTAVIKGISLQIPAGATVAFVGPSGSGKSTLLKLIARFWDVDSGQVIIGGTDVRTLAPEVLTDMIAVVSQDAFLFDMTIRENLLLAKPDATEAEMQQALHLAYCDDVLAALPDGLDSHTGENGGLLSGGQRQRLCIARAFLKDAPILLLDEITANVDMDSERGIQLALSELAKQKTVIMVAHRLKTIRGADRIFVLKDGTLAGQGSHEVLIADCPVYQTLWQACEKAGNWSLGKAVAEIC